MSKKRNKIFDFENKFKNDYNMHNEVISAYESNIGDAKLNYWRINRMVIGSLLYGKYWFSSTHLNVIHK